MTLEKIRGFSNLKKNHQQLFIRVHAAHQKCVENQAAWQPTSVRWMKDFLKVTFANGEWLHYTPTGEWY